MRPENQTSFSDILPHVPLARVQVLVPFPTDKAYEYTVPEGVNLCPGQYVRVPVGNRELYGVVWEIGKGDKKLPDSKIKPVLQIYDIPPMTADHRNFIDWVARYTMAPLGTILKMVLNIPSVFDSPKPVISYYLPDNEPSSNISLTPQRQKVVEILRTGVCLRASDLARRAGCSPSVVKSMADSGILCSKDDPPDPPCVHPDINIEGLNLSKDQSCAAKDLVSCVRKKEYAAILLDGVTGAGKTEVYFEAVRAAFDQGQQVLVLLPEISLSQQFIQRFERHFGVLPAVWHSDISKAQKRLIWRGVAMGETKFVVGARSALFLPFQNLGLIVVDEEHDTSYKQEEGVVYHARDMAVVRAHKASVPVVLVSATPSLETIWNVRQGRYRALHLPARHGGAKLPDIHVIDLREDEPERQSFLSPTLKEAIKKTIVANEQVLLFLNRRGYAPLTLCRKCGHRFQCPSCTAWLVEHRRTSRLQCHHCGYYVSTPNECPDCGTADSLAACGPGVERIAEEVKTLLPDARLLIMASDITNSPALLHQAIQSITDHHVDIVIGTQMIAKGHHFPNLTCVGVVDADLGLEGGDLRASERTYQLLHQVAGRAGRADKAGHVYIQSYMPDNRVIQALATHDRDAFLDAEIEERKLAQVPPFGRMASLVVTGADERLVDKVSFDLGRLAPHMEGVKVLGPAPAQMAVLRNKHRRRLLIKTVKDIALQKVIEQWLAKMKIPAKIQVKVDIDPQNFL